MCFSIQHTSHPQFIALALTTVKIQARQGKGTAMQISHQIYRHFRKWLLVVFCQNIQERTQLLQPVGGGVTDNQLDRC